MRRFPPALAAVATPRILELLADGPGRVLELGFAGIHAQPLELAGWEVVVVEPDPAQAARAQGHFDAVVARPEPISPKSTRCASFSSRRMDPCTSCVRGSVELRVALTVPDFDRAVAFYRDTLGLEQLADWSGEDGRVILLDAGSATLELFDEQQAESVDRIEAGRRVSGPVRLAIRVDDVEAAADRLLAAGAQAMAPPVVPPWGGRNARLRAPDGMQLTLFSEP
jgi:lactoylglutathione lyase